MSRRSTSWLIAIVFLQVTYIIPYGRAEVLKDVRRVPITRVMLTHDIQQVPLSSPVQLQDLMRASHSRLINVAYELYTHAWQQNPRNPDANLLRGLSAELYWEDSMDPTIRHLYGLNSSRGDCFSAAANCLKQAITLAPHSATANTEYGYFLWQFGEQEAQGLALIKKAAQLAPKDPRVHATLGLIYSNQSGNAYSLTQAVAELQLAAQLDRSYAYPHSLLADIYASLGRVSEAQEQRRIYQSLLP